MIDIYINQLKFLLTGPSPSLSKTVNKIGEVFF